jgi:chromosome segregation ATPase
VEVESEVELRQYREKVIVELERRHNRLRELDNDIATTQFHLDAATRARRTLRGETARIKVEEAHRTKLKSDLKSLEAKRREAQSDLERAEQRLKEVDQRIDQIERSHEPV